MGSITQYGSRLYISGGFNTLLGAASQPQLAALDAATGVFDPGFVPPARYPGRFEGHTGKRIDDPITSDSQRNGAINSLLVTPDGRYLLVSGSFLHFGTDHIADPDHRHGGLISLDPATGNLTEWQPTWGGNSSRPVFGMTLYPGDPKSIGVNAPALVFTAAGGGGVASSPGPRAGRPVSCGAAASTVTPCRWPPRPSGSTWWATSTTSCPTPTTPASRSATSVTAATA